MEIFLASVYVTMVNIKASKRLATTGMLPVNR